MGQIVKYGEWSVRTNYSVMSWRPKKPGPGLLKNMTPKVCVSLVLEQQTGHCHHSAGRETPTHSLEECFSLSIRTHTYLYVHRPDAQSRTLTCTIMNNSCTVLTVHVASQLSAHTPSVNAPVISAHFSRTVWKEIATLLSSLLFFFSVLAILFSFSFSLPLCLCPWWPSCWVVRLTALTLALGLT